MSEKQQWTICVCSRCRMPVEDGAHIEAPYCMCSDENFEPDESDTVMVEVTEVTGR